MEALTTGSPENKSNEKLSQTIIKRIADCEGVNPEELSPPLYSAIDLDALETLFKSSTRDKPQSLRYVSFTYNGYKVQVQSDGEVSIAKVEEALE